MSRRIAVCISDIHFNLATLELASSALRSALSRAEELNIPLVIAGDLNDSKSIIQAKVANSIISILKNATVKIYILVGNHDMLNEKGQDHGLTYLSPYATIIDSVTHLPEFTLIPYHNSSEKLTQELKTLHPSTILIMHQGFLGASMGDYVQDRTSISTEAVKAFTVISGHYHRHQTVGTVTYIGSPYSITFGEANDGPKGFLILNKDGSFERVITNLRKHVIIERSLENLHDSISPVNSEDLLWLKIKGNYSDLQKINKETIGKLFIGHSNFKLDLIEESTVELVNTIDNMTDVDILDGIIDNIKDTDEFKTYLKGLWRELINGGSQ